VNSDSLNALMPANATAEIRPAPTLGPALPVMVAASGERAGMRFLEFFTAQIRNPHTRRPTHAPRLSFWRGAGT
jgi:hypothetical protein